MSGLITRDEAGGLTRFDPLAAKERDIEADSVIAWASRLGKWEELEEAVDFKITQQREFVEWWGGRVTNRKGGGTKTRNGVLVSVDEAEAATKITQQQVSKWRKRLQHEDEYRASIFGAAYRKAMDGSQGGEMSVHYSSATPEWATPQNLFDALNAEFAFDVDVCATTENAKCAHFYSAAMHSASAAGAMTEDNV